MRMKNIVIHITAIIIIIIIIIHYNPISSHVPQTHHVSRVRTTVYATCNVIIIIIVIIIPYNPIYSHVPQTHHVCTVRTAAAILQLQFMLHVLLLLLLLLLLLFVITLFTIMYPKHTMSVRYVLL